MKEIEEYTKIYDLLRACKEITDLMFNMMINDLKKRIEDNVN